MTVRCWIVLVLILAGCSTPRYYYYFDTSPLADAKASAGKPAPLLGGEEGNRQSHSLLRRNSGIADAPTAPVETSEIYTASLDARQAVQTTPGIIVPPVKRAHVPSSHLVQPATQDRGMSPEPAPPAKTMHADLKRSIIFVILGIGLLIVGEEVLVVVGSLSLIIGIIFGIKWLLR